MDIYNVTVKKTLVGEKEELLLYSNGHQIQEDDISEEEINLLEELVQRYRNKYSTGRTEVCRRFFLASEEEAKKISSNLEGINIDSQVERNNVIVYGAGNINIATTYINLYKRYEAGKEALSK